ncbi:MAG: hypothetical protein LQ340_000321 [Diploschistes diacapsis]|nr:MAG: hypothetical protein LQ340_000321 [Diploschistes diacapsis]
MFSQGHSSHSAAAFHVDESTDEKRYLPPGSYDTETCDPKVTTIDVPVSKARQYYVEISQQDVSGSFSNRKKTGVGKGWQPRNTLDEKTRAPASRTVSTDIYRSKVAPQRMKTISNAGPCPKRRRVGRHEHESISDSDGEDPLTKDTGRLKRPSERKQLQSTEDAKLSIRRPTVSKPVINNSEYQKVEKKMSSQGYGRRGGKHGKWGITDTFQSISDKSPSDHSATRTSPNAQDRRAEASINAQINAKSKMNGTLSRYFGQKPSSIPGKDMENAIDLEGLDRNINCTIPASTVEASNKSHHHHDMSTEGGRQSTNPQPTPLSVESTDMELVAKAEIKERPQQARQPDVSKKKSERPREASASSKPEAKKALAFGIRWYATDLHPRGKTGDFSLVFDETRHCLDLYCEGKPIDEDLIPARLIQKWEYPKFTDTTAIKFHLSIRVGQPHIIFIDCADHKAFTALTLCLQNFGSPVPDIVSQERYNKVLEKFRQGRVKVAPPRDDRDDLELIREKKRRRDEENSSQMDDKQEQKKPRIATKLRDRLIGGDDTQQQHQQHHMYRETAGGADPKFTAKELSDADEADPQKNNRAVKKYTCIDDILEQTGHSEIPKRSGLRSRSTKQPASLNIGSQFDLEDFPEHLRFSKAHGLGRRWRRPLTFPKEGKKKATVEFDDLPKLDEGQCLNDSVIEFYLRYLMHGIEMKSPETAKNVYFFNTYFFSSLKGTSGKINYNNVKKWTRNVDLFLYDYIVVPINESFHWYLAIICNLSSIKRNAPSLQDDSDAEISDAGGEEHDTTALTEEAQDSQTPIAEAKDQESHDQSASIPKSVVLSAASPFRREAERTRESFSDLRLDDTSEQNSVTKQNGGLPRNSTDVEPVKESRSGPVACSIEVRVPKRTNEELALPTETNAKSSTLIQQARSSSSQRKSKRKSVGTPRVYKPDQPAVITLDSLGFAHPPAVRALREYLIEEAKEKRGGMTFDASEIKGMTAKGIPQQSNFSDCGLYLLGYMDKFVEDPRDFVTRLLQKQYDEAKDWPKLRPSDMRAQVRELIQGLHKDQESERAGKQASLLRASDTPSQGKPQKELEHPVQASEAVEKSPETQPQDSKNIRLGDGRSDNAADQLNIPTQTRQSALASALPLDASMPGGQDVRLQSCSPTAEDHRSCSDLVHPDLETEIIVPDSQDEQPSASQLFPCVTIPDHPREELVLREGTAHDAATTIKEDGAMNVVEERNTPPMTFERLQNQPVTSSTISVIDVKAAEVADVSSDSGYRLGKKKKREGRGGQEGAIEVVTVDA